MSEYMVKDEKTGREIIYGLDKSTGGYFWQEYYSIDELGELDEYLSEIVEDKEGLSLTLLIDDMKKLFGMDIPVDKLVEDFFQEPVIYIRQNPPESLYFRDIPSMLKEIEMDVIKIKMERG